MKYFLNKIDNEFIQIYGEVNGIACVNRKRIPTYCLDINFFINNKLIHITSSRPCNFTNETFLRERIDKILSEELSKEEIQYV